MKHAVQTRDIVDQPQGALASRTLAMPANTNPRGDIFGGWIMALMDTAA
jgi:acyl-CoA thioesterase YciA